MRSNQRLALAIHSNYIYVHSIGEAKRIIFAKFSINLQAFLESANKTSWRTPNYHQRHYGAKVYQVSHSSHNVLRARRGVIRMLIIVVLTFAVCNLPIHARKMWQYWWVFVDIVVGKLINHGGVDCELWPQPLLFSYVTMESTFVQDFLDWFSSLCFCHHSVGGFVNFENSFLELII